VIATRHGGVRAKHRGTLVLTEGCALQIIGLAVLVAAVACAVTPFATLLSVVLIVFGNGQGLVMAPLSSAVLSSVKPVSAGSASEMYGTTAQIAYASGVAAIGAVFFAVEAAYAARPALFISASLFALAIVTSAAFLSWMRRVSARCRITALAENSWGSTAHGLFILHCSNYLFWVTLGFSLSPGAAGVPCQEY
jgi:hypothetical protein